MRKLTLVAVGLAAALSVAACGDDSGDPADPVDGAGASQAPAGSDTGDSADSGDQAAGTVDNPIGTGEEFAIGDWLVEVGGTNTDAAEAIAAGVGYDEPPAAGRQYVMAEVTVAYAGTSSSDPFIDLTFSYTAADGTTFGEGVDDLCGLLPNDLFEVGELAPGGSATANVCVAVPAESIEGGVWMVEDLWALDDSGTTYVAVG